MEKDKNFILAEKFLSIIQENESLLRETRESFDKKLMDIILVIQDLKKETEKIAESIISIKGDHDELIILKINNIQLLRDIDALHEKHRNYEKELQNLRDWKTKTMVYVSGVAVLISFVTAVLLKKVF